MADGPGMRALRPPTSHLRAAPSDVPPRPQASPTRARSVPAVERAILILKALGRSGTGQRLSDLSRELAINKSTAFQILQVLERHGLVERDVDSLRYRLAYGVVELGSTVLGRLDLRAVARPSVRELVAQTGETVFLGVRDGDRIVIVDKEESPADLKITSPVGQRIPLTAGAFGKVFLAYGPGEDAGRLAKRFLRRFTPRTIIETTQYGQVLAETRQRGYALDDEEYLEGVRAVSAPVFGPQGALVAALAVVGFASSMADARIPALVEATVHAGEAISRRLGAAGAHASTSTRTEAVLRNDRQASSESPQGDTL